MKRGFVWVMNGTADLRWLSRFVDETPGDPICDRIPRQVMEACWSRIAPVKTPSPELVAWSKEMAHLLGVDEGDSELFNGNNLCEGMDPYAQCYGGHQFGNWARQLGDGRAITLGEVETSEGVLELQLKGSGMTPYSRNADGKAVLRSSVREFLCSEAMFHLGVPTTRALSLYTTGENVIRDILYNGNPGKEPGAIVCRVSPSFLRFGSYQIHTSRNDIDTLRTLVNFTLKTHFSHIKSTGDEQIIQWMKEVAKSTSNMVTHWMRVGFVHGVMNTDNMSIHGLTIDYGPYGWIEDYDLNWTPNTTDRATRRYRYGQQPRIAGWNLARLLEAISPLMNEPEKLQSIMDYYEVCFSESLEEMWCDKLGLKQYDESLTNSLIKLLHETETDMTIFFRELSKIESPEIEPISKAFYDFEKAPVDQWVEWLTSYLQLVKPERALAMNQINPKYVLRNWMAQLAIDDAEKGDYGLVEQLYELLKNPYEEQDTMEEKWYSKRPEWARNRVGCSMLSCSS